MKRGEIWTVSGGPHYAGKPRPAVILQSDRFDATDSVTVCPLTTDAIDLPLFRIPVTPSPANGLRSASRIMADKVTTVRRAKLGKLLGRLTETELISLDRAVLVFLGLV
ncbi:MAG: type II toxin-antitoxin system PemK/MazF family toxin [Rhodospirillales bacterium]|nr:type II toxin-antitoxin system PemK/MazF family toxin [Rhodospirillales bacterium]